MPYSCLFHSSLFLILLLILLFLFLTLLLFLLFLDSSAFDQTGRIINITVAPINNYDPPRLLNYLTAPHVCVWSAACASCAVPGLFDSITLIIKGRLIFNIVVLYFLLPIFLFSNAVYYITVHQIILYSAIMYESSSLWSFIQ